MSSAGTAVQIPGFEFIYDDGEPLETWWHRAEGDLFIDVIGQLMAARGRDDYFVGGNMFVYYSLEQAHAVATQPPDTTRHFRGPDVFMVNGVGGRIERKAWTVWEEAGRYPNLILELLSPSTERVDRTIKKDIYEQTFRTPDYFYYHRDRDDLTGFHLVEGSYRPLEPNERGWLWSRELGCWVGRWQGVYQRVESGWLRLYDTDGRLVPTRDDAAEQRADAEQQRADAEQQRADAEQQRADAERQRADAEQQRADAERQRADAEQQRAATEQQRAAAEQQRADAEQQRAETAEEELSRLRARLASDGA